MDKQFLEYFRCPPNYVDLRLKGELLPGRGFFRVGSDLTCYGRVSAGKPCLSSSGLLDDVFSAVHVEKSACVLPFDLDEVVQNLRLERYDGAMPVVRSSVQNLSLAKPIMPCVLSCPPLYANICSAWPFADGIAPAFLAGPSIKPSTVCSIA